MDEMPRDEQTLRRLQAGVDGELTPLGEAWLAERLASDAQLQGELDARRALAGRLREALAAHPAPPALDGLARARLRIAARQVPARSWRWVALAACVLLAIGGLTFGFPAMSIRGLDARPLAVGGKPAADTEENSWLMAGDGDRRATGVAPVPMDAQRAVRERSKAVDGDGQALGAPMSAVDGVEMPGPGREEAVSDSKMGGAGVVTAIGAGGGRAHGFSPSPPSPPSSPAGSVVAARAMAGQSSGRMPTGGGADGRKASEDKELSGYRGESLRPEDAPFSGAVAAVQKKAQLQDALPNVMPPAGERAAAWRSLEGKSQDALLKDLKSKPGDLREPQQPYGARARESMPGETAPTSAEELKKESEKRGPQTGADAPIYLAGMPDEEASRRLGQWQGNGNHQALARDVPGASNSLAFQNPALEQPGARTSTYGKAQDGASPESLAGDGILLKQADGALVLDHIGLGRSVRANLDNVADARSAPPPALPLALPLPDRLAAPVSGWLGAQRATVPVSSLAVRLDGALGEAGGRSVELDGRMTTGQAALLAAQVAGMQLRCAPAGLYTAAPQAMDPLRERMLTPAQFTAAWGTAPMRAVAERADQTFALSSDTGAYTLAQQALARGQRPDPLAMRPEHFCNAFPGDHAEPREAPVALYAEGAPHPLLDDGTVLVAVTAVTRAPRPGERRPVDLAVCLDASGSMARPGGMDRAWSQVRQLAARLGEGDRLSVVAFSDRARLLLPPVGGAQAAAAVARLGEPRADGATHPDEGLRLAYQLVRERANDRSDRAVLLLTDGGSLDGGLLGQALDQVGGDRGQRVDLIVGCVGDRPADAAGLQRRTEQADGRLLMLSGEGPLDERLLPERLGSVARDAKCQVVWNPGRVAAARLVGFDEQRLAAADFRNDAVDAAELAGATRVTALFEIVLVEGGAGPLGTARLRYAHGRDVREDALPLGADLLHARASDRLRLWAVAAATGEWLQGGWWANCRAWNAARLLGALDQIPPGAAATQAVELRRLLHRAQRVLP